MPSSALWPFRRSSGRERRIPEDRRLQFRIGVHVGDVVVRGGDLLGDGVNVAARLEGFAEPGGIAISGAAHGYVRKALPLAYIDIGEQHVKNIDEPVRAYAVKHASASAPPSTSRPKPPLHLVGLVGKWTAAGTSSAREPLAGQRQANEERAMGQRTSQLRPTSRCDVITVASTRPAAHSHRLVKSDRGSHSPCRRPSC